MVTQRYKSITMLIALYALLTLSSILATGCAQPEPVDEASLYVREIDGEAFTAEQVREVSGGLALHRDGDAYECSMCHEGFSNDPNLKPLEGEHADLVFDHGLNTDCLSCHNPTNSDAFLNHDGTELASDQSTMLCSKCHGVVFRDWEKGLHGRMSSVWNASFGERKNMDCIECHDPHTPGFPSMKPDPAPALSRLILQADEAE